jgi:hypothetical protein
VLGIADIMVDSYDTPRYAEADRDSWPKLLVLFEKYLRQASVAAG